MKINVVLNPDTRAQQMKTFCDVACVTAHANENYPGVQMWTKYQEEGFGSEERVNINPSQYRIETVDYDTYGEQLFVYAVDV